jgi:predicted acyltransferase
VQLARIIPALADLDSKLDSRLDKGNRRRVISGFLEKFSSIQSVSQAPDSGRLLFLDLFRGMAVFGMFDAHLTNALVRLPDPLQGIPYYHDKLFNLPAPGFLFAAGISFGMSVVRRWEAYRTWSPALRSRLVRLLEIALLGFVLHLPFFSLYRTVHQSSFQQILKFVNMDVLQCIAASAFGALALVWATRDVRQFFRATLSVAAAIALASPLAWSLSAHFPWWIGTYTSKLWGSVFPLFPYAAFLFAGAAWGYLFAQSERAATKPRLMRQSGWAGLGMIVAGTALAWLPLPPPYDDFWNASPQFFLIRVGLFVALLPALARVTSTASLPARVMLPLGTESLAVYIAHLMIIYGSFVNPRMNLNKMIGGTLGPLGWFTGLAALTLAMIVFASLWRALKNFRRWNFERLEWAFAVALGVIYVIR